MVVNDEKRKIGLDILKIISAFLVICIHAPFEGKVGQYFITLARCAVPIFFMITGFFYNEKIDSPKANKQIFKVLKLVIFSNIFYFIFKLILCSIDEKSHMVLIKNVFNKKSLLYLFILNESPIWSHLWYLNALLYVLIIIKVINKYKLMKYAYFITPALLMIDLIFGKYSLLLLHKEIPYIYVRNFLFVGIPYFCIGNYINKKIYNKIKENSNTKYILLALFFFLTSGLERYILVHFNVNAIRDHYISTTFLSISLFLYFLTYKNNKSTNKIDNFISKIGKEYSTLVYILHPACIEVLNRLIGGCSLYREGYPVFIFGFTIIFCVVYKKILVIINSKNNCY